jgi:hypothetical protein
LIETEAAWKDYSSLTSVFLETKRYKIVMTEAFSTEEDALKFIQENTPFKMRPKTAGCVILDIEKTLDTPLTSPQKDENKLNKYLFFTQNKTPKE